MDTTKPRRDNTPRTRRFVALAAIIAIVAISFGVIAAAGDVESAADEVHSDLDGCSDAEELGPDPALGGQRDPNYFWDLFDVPAGNPPARNATVTVGDILAVVARFGNSGDPTSTPLSSPPPAAYHPAFDRSPPGPGQDVWDAAPPDGAVSVTDIALVVAQFGHGCQGPAVPRLWFDQKLPGAWGDMVDHMQNVVGPIGASLAQNEVQILGGQAPALPFGAQVVCWDVVDGTDLVVVVGGLPTPPLHDTGDLEIDTDEAPSMPAPLPTDTLLQEQEEVDNDQPAC